MGVHIIGKSHIHSTVQGHPAKALENLEGSLKLKDIHDTLEWKLEIATITRGLKSEE